MVDTKTGRRFPRLELLCLGYITSDGIVATGGAGHPALFLSVNAQGPNSNEDSAQVVEVDLRTYTVTWSKVFPEGVGEKLVSALGEIWTTIGGPGSDGWTLVGLDPRTLAVEHRVAFDYYFDFQPLGGYVWIAAGMHGLLRYDPGDGKLAHIPLALAPSTAVGEIGTSSGVAYLGVSGLTGSANAVVAYSPATGALVRYPFMFITRIVPTPGGFAWVFPQGGNVSEVFALSLRRPVPDGAGCVGFNGVWSVNFDAEADMFCEESGVPMTCASGETGRVLASLTVPGATKYDDGTPGTSPPVIAVGDGLLLLAAGRSGSSPVYGVAIYQLDPRCQ